MPSYTKPQQGSNEPNNNSDQSRPALSSSPPISKSDRQPPELEKRASVQSGQSSLSSTSGNSDEVRQQFSSNADYDHIRNTTLMFFLDRLFIASKDGKEARTLHDLSCLFGTRDFTKEMRQIVGASRNGLKKFLQSYPSLFTIDGDKVYLTQLKQDATNPAVRDYNKEAVEYFTQKLLQFGISLVPIRNLFGYRSQASQEVRHVSGKNTKEFKQFLSAHDDVFEILADDHVVLKSALREMESRGDKPSSLQQQTTVPNEDSIMDPYLNKQFAHLIEDCMKKMTQVESDETGAALNTTTGESDQAIQSDHQPIRVTLEYLHDRIMQDCNNPLFLKMVKTIEDLKVFLRMHPKIFKRFKCDQSQREYVSLLTEEERREMELLAYPSLLARQHSTLKRCNTNESQLSDNSSKHQPISLPPLINYQQQQSTEHQPIPLMTQQSKSSGAIKRNSIRSTSNNNNNHNDNQDDNQDDRSIISNASSHNNSSSLRATAPPFVPSTHSQPRSLQINNQRHSHNQHKMPLQRNSSNLSSTTSNQQQPGNQRAVIDPRHALRSYLIKASAGNTSNGLYSPNKLSNGAQPLGRQNSNGISGGNGVTSNEDLRARTVDIVREASNIITRIMTTTDAVAFDCKGYNLGFNGQITLIQFAFLPKSEPKTTTSHHRLLQQATDENHRPQAAAKGKQKPDVCLFDLITNPELAYCLKPLLESDRIVKIVHDVRNKSNALYVQFGIILNNVFDTQVANLVIQQQETGKPAYKSRYISMSKLCEIYGDEQLTKYRDLIKSKTRHSNSGAQANSSSSKIKDVNYWCTRPLTDAMVYESTMDVYCLVGGVYQNLKSRIKTEYEPLFEQLNLEGVLARIKPDEIRSVKKERKIDLEVIDLKRKLYSDTTSTIVLSNREIRLLRHIDLTEEVRQKIQQCRKVAKKLERLDMKATQAKQLQSSNDSQASTDCDGPDQSLDINMSLQTNGSSSNGSASMAQCQSDVVDAKQSTDVDDTTENATELVNSLMDGSMFDELKDKMIESSSLLESLEDDDDDDDDDITGDRRHKVAHAHHHGASHEDCRCNCHRSSIDGGKTAELGNQGAASPPQPTAPLELPSVEDNEGEEDKTSVESKVVDMAVQCDLLS